MIISVIQKQYVKNSTAKNRHIVFKSASRVWPALIISLTYCKNNTTQIMPRNNDVSKRRLKHAAILYNPRRRFRKKIKKKIIGRTLAR